MRMWAVATTLLALSQVAPALAVDNTLVHQGRALAQGQCGQCHSTGLRGQSPRLAAPPLRTLGERFPVEDLQEALAEGISVGHPEMPQVLWEARDIEAFTAYIRSLQSAKPHLR